MIETIPEGFISDPAVLEVVKQFGGLQVGDEVVLGGTVCSEFQYAVIKIVRIVPPPYQVGFFRTISAPNDESGYAMGYARRDGTWHQTWDNVMAWRRPT